MKLKPFIHERPGKIIAGTTLVDDKPRADMFMPAWLLTVGLLFASIGVLIGFVMIYFSPAFVAAGAVLALIGGVLLLWWKNQMIHMLPDDTFRYRTMFGKKTVYRFSEIRGIKRGNGYVVLLMGEGKVYVDSSAIVSDRLAERIDQRLNEIYEDPQPIR